MSDDLERTLHDSLSRHAAQLGRPAGSIETVYERVTRRRTRRRAVAGFGSLAVAAVGVIGIATVSSGGGEAPASGSLGPNEAWSCTGMLGGDGTATFYSDCAAVDLDDVTTATAVPCVPATAATTVPVTWVDSIAVAETTDATPAFDVCAASGTFPPATTYAIDTTPPSPCGAPTTAVPVTTLEPAATVTTIVFISACEPHEQIYIVQRGDSVYGISAVFGIDPDALARYNEWPEGINHGLEPGDLIMIPSGYLKAPPPATTDVLATDTTAVPATEAPPTTAP